MAIAYLVSQFPKPSETFVSRELLSLQGLGLEVKPFAFETPSPDDARHLDSSTRGLIGEVEYLSPGRVLRSGFRNWGGAVKGWRQNHLLHGVSTLKSNSQVRLWRVAALARRLEQSGITHLHAHWPYATQVAFLVHKLTGIPFSVSIHAHEVEHDAGHFPTVFESLAFATFCNRAAMDRLLSRLPFPAHRRCHLIYHGVDLQRFAALPFPATTSPLRVISAGRLTRTKGFDRLIRGCASFRRQGGAIDLTILGQGGQESDLKKLAAAQGLAGCVHFPGWLPHDQVAHRLSQAHVFALLADTNFHDGLPNVVLEAMASARPVILSPLPAAAEAVTDGVEGFILPRADDENALAQLLHKISSTPARLAIMGQAAHDRIARLFDQTLHAQQLKRLFETGAGPGLERGCP